MKFSSWLVNNSTPLERIWIRRIAISIDPELFRYIVNVERTLKQERRLETARVCVVDVTTLEPSEIVHLDRNILRLWPDKNVDAFIRHYKCKAGFHKTASMMYYACEAYEKAFDNKLMRREYEQALIKLERERERRKRVYNLD